MAHSTQRENPALGKPHATIVRMPSASSAFLVGVDSPTVTGDRNGTTPAFHRMLTVGAESDRHVDCVGGAFPRLKISILRTRLVVYVVVTALFLTALTAVAYVGIPVDELRTAIGVPDARAESLVERYNTISGFVLALVEGLLALFMANFLSTYLVYLHNTLWFLHRNDTVNKTSNALRSALMVLFPVLMVLLIGNSLRSLQASLSTVGFDSIMTSDDLRREQPLINGDNDKINRSDILSNALGGSSIPFQIDMSSPCTGDQRPNAMRLSVHDLDATNVVYGFTAREWNSEALNDLPNNSPSSDFDPKVAFNLFVQGKILLDKGMASSIRKYHPCDKTDPHESCNGMKATLVNASKALAAPAKQTQQKLVQLVTDGLGDLISGLNRTDVSVQLQNYSISSQIQLNLMTIDGYTPLYTNATIKGVNVSNLADTSSTFCGSHNCVFVDLTPQSYVPHQVVLLPSYTNCKLDNNSIKYSADLRMYFPDCDTEENAFVAVGTTTYITGDEYGSSYAKLDNQSDANTTDGPYILNPRRHVRLTIARYTWTPRDLASEFGASCQRRDAANCTGLAFKLPQSGRYVFASEDALPLARIRASSLLSPHRLIQLNRASVYLAREYRSFLLERLDSDNFNSTQWSSQGLSGRQCSRLMSSHIDHVERNGYVLDRSMRAVYRSAFFFLLSNGSVTDLHNASTAHNTRGHSADQRGASSLLEYVRLKGDVQLRAIRVNVPLKSYIASLVGCAGLVAVALLVWILPSRRLEYFAPDTSEAAKYIVVRNTERYPNALYRKTLLFPATNEALPIEDFAISELKLVNRAIPDDEIVL